MHMRMHIVPMLLLLGFLFSWMFVKEGTARISTAAYQFPVPFCFATVLPLSPCPSVCPSASLSLCVYVLSRCLACLSVVCLPPCPECVNHPKTAEKCTDENVRELCGYDEVDESLLPEDVPDLNVCVCRVASGAW